MTAPPLSEAGLQRRILDLAAYTGWRAVHVRPARTNRGYRTAYEGDPGLPDIVMARGGRVLLAELKSSAGRPTADQQAWLDAAGDHGRLWRPADWPTIVEELT